MLMYTKVWKFAAFLSITTLFCESIRGFTTVNTTSTDFIQELEEPKAFLECKEAPRTPEDRRKDTYITRYGRTSKPPERLLNDAQACLITPEEHEEIKHFSKT